jgi:hypothetical protein
LEANAKLFIRFERACVWNLFLLAICGVQAADSPPVNGWYTATAYSTPGKTASGEYTQRHIVAADPDLLPIGSVIEIKQRINQVKHGEAPNASGNPPRTNPPE